MGLYAPYRRSLNSRNGIEAIPKNPLEASMESPEVINPKYGADKRFKAHRQYNIKAIWEHQDTIVEMVCLGSSNVEIAEALGITPQTVSNIRNSKVVLEKIAEFRARREREMMDINERVQQFAPVAIKLIEDLILDDDEPKSLRAKYAAQHLDRAGYGPIHKNLNVHRTMTREEIEEIKKRHRAAAAEAGIDTIDGSFTRA